MTEIGRAGHATRACPRPRASSSEGARRRASRPTCWPRSSTPSRRVAGAEVTVECNPEDASATIASHVWRSAGVTRVSFGVQSMVPHVLAGLGRRHGPPSCVVRAVALAGRGGLRLGERRPHLRGRRGDRRRLGRHSLETVLALDPPPAARERLRPHRRARHPARRRPVTPSRRRRPGAPLRAGRRTFSAPPATAGTRCRTGPRPGHECRHNRLYWDQGDYRGHRVAPPTRTGTAAGGGTSGHPSATSPRSAPDARRRPARRCSTDRPTGLRERWPWPCGRRAGCPRRLVPDDPDLARLVERRRRSGGAHGRRAGCWPTR